MHENQRKLKMLKIYWDANRKSRKNQYLLITQSPDHLHGPNFTSDRILNRVLYCKYGQGMQSIEDVEAPGESQECEALGVEKLRVTGRVGSVKSMEMGA